MAADSSNIERLTNSVNQHPNLPAENVKFAHVQTTIGIVDTANNNFSTGLPNSKYLDTNLFLIRDGRFKYQLANEIQLCGHDKIAVLLSLENVTSGVNLLATWGMTGRDHLRTLYNKLKAMDYQNDPKMANLVCFLEESAKRE